MIEFSLELSGLIAPQFRLQSDKKTWRRLASNDWLETDFKTDDLYEIIQLQEVDRTVTIDSQAYRLNVTESSFGDMAHELHYCVYVHRDYFPITPSMEQMVSVIKHGDDRISNALILNVHGFFELRERGTVNLAIVDPTIIARYETFVAGNGYVGQKPANDMAFINRVYNDFIAAWADHVQSGATDIDMGEMVPVQPDDCLAEIDKARQDFERAAEEADE